MQTDSMIQLHGITKSFGSLQVLRGIDLQVNRGEVVPLWDQAVQERPPCCKSWVHSTARMRVK